MNLEDIRGRIAALQAERKAVERAWPSSDECAAGIAATVKRLAAGGRQVLQPARLRKGKLGDSFSVSHHDVLAILAALDPERITTRLVEIAHEEHPEPGLSSADRGRRLAEIEVELRGLAIEEERLIRSSAAPIIRRADADPEIVLSPDLDRLAA